MSACGFLCCFGAFNMENRSLKLDLVALSLLVLALFFGLSLATYDPADPVVELVAPLNRIVHADVLVYPQNTRVKNACGKWGALCASTALTGLGVGAYYLVVSLTILDTLFLARREIDAPLVRLLGWCISLVGITAIATLLVPALSPGPVIGSGGYLGAFGAGLLQWHFALIGGVILATSLVAGGLLLCTDYALIQVIRAIVRTVFRAAIYGSRSRPTGKKSTAKKRSAKAGKSDGEEVSIRVGGVPVNEELEEMDGLADEDEEDDEDSVADAEDEDKDEDEEDVADESGDERELVVRGQKKKLRRDRADRTAGPRVRRKKKHDERQAVMQRLDEASLGNEPQDYQLPDMNLLIEQDDICFEAQAKEVRRKAKILEKTFANFGFNVKVVEIETGPVIAQYEVELEAGLRLSRITGLADDLAIALRVPSVRIVAPIPGKNTVGIEVPNEARQVVRLREVMEESHNKTNKMRIPLFLGKDVSGNSLVVDLSTLPHLLIAGRTGTGKSVCLNAIISSILMTRRPDEVRMLMIDPKMVELSCYGRLPHLMHPVVTDMRKAEAILAWAVEKMEERYSLLARSGVRHITSYNQLGKDELADRLQPETDEERDSIPDHLPFIVIVADEIADLMMTSGKEVEQHIIRLAQKSRAVGIHLILATQKPTVDVITGLIKSNLPARISFQVASRTDSRVVLDEMGAEKLLGNGDMLFLWPGTSMLLRGQGTYLTDDEINAVVATVSTGEQNFVNELVNIRVKEDGEMAEPGELRKRDELYESAIDVIVREGRGSVSLLQRALGIGYGRAARLVDFMAEDGFVGDYNGSQAREVLLSPADWERMQGIEPEEESQVRQTVQPKAIHRKNVIIPATDNHDNEPEIAKTSAAVTTRTKRRKIRMDELPPDEDLDDEHARDTGPEAESPWDSETDEDADESQADYDNSTPQLAYSAADEDDVEDDAYDEEYDADDPDDADEDRQFELEDEEDEAEDDEGEDDEYEYEDEDEVEELEDDAEEHAEDDEDEDEDEDEETEYFRDETAYEIVRAGRRAR